MEFSLENMCRTCMNEDGTMFSVFTHQEKRGKCYADMLMACAALNVERNDDLPQNICQHCLKHLTIAFSFKQQSERSEATLREITKNPDIEFIKEELFDDAEQHVEFKLTEEFLEDEYINNEEIPEVKKPKRKLINPLNAKKEKREYHALETEFLEDDFTLEDDEIQQTDPDTDRAFTLPESKEFLQDNIVCDINSRTEKFKISYDLETLRKAVLKPKSSSRGIVAREYPEINTDFTVDTLRKAVLTPKSKPSPNRIIRELKCPYCEQIFRSPIAFKKHKKQHVRKLKCDLCFKEFRSTHGLRYHMKIHNGIKNYPCNFGNCTKRFRLKQALDKHLSIHNNEKNHLCSLCGKTYSTYDALHYHLKAHRGERPYLCIHCGKTFKQSCHLKSHMWVHSGIKPHVCNCCGKTYTSGHQLKKHIKKHCSAPMVDIVTRTNTTDPLEESDIAYATENIEEEDSTEIRYIDAAQVVEITHLANNTEVADSGQIVEITHLANNAEVESAQVVEISHLEDSTTEVEDATAEDEVARATESLQTLVTTIVTCN